MIKCIICFKEADYIIDGNSYCEKHANELSKRNRERIIENSKELNKEARRVIKRAKEVF